jgi:hypothetical protein
VALPTLKSVTARPTGSSPGENGRIVAKAIPHARLAMIQNASRIFFTDPARPHRPARCSLVSRDGLR